MAIEREVMIEVGALGRIMFSPGYYVYTGRAGRNLKKRLARHTSMNKKLRWHIDYLTLNAKILGTRIYPNQQSDECSINNNIARANGMVFPVKGFGSSDCKCSAHLAWRASLISKVDLNMGEMF